MDFEHWKASELVNLPFAVLLLKMLWDAVYKQIPEGFASIRQVADDAHANAETRHAEDMRVQKKIRKLMKKITDEAPKKKTLRVTHHPGDNGKPTRS